MFAEARAELDAVSVTEQDAIEVAQARVDLGMETKEWLIVLEAAERVCMEKPTSERAWIAWAYALRELHRVEEAKDVLLRAEELHGKCGVLHYNLACYFCLLGDQPEAERRLKLAGELDENWRNAALEDPDLRAMRSRLASKD
jgi:tetratricopeptide (TPR) repeat protein